MPINDTAVSDNNFDALQHEALLFVTEKGKITVSDLQRKLRTGYNSTLSILEGLEEAGHIVSEYVCHAEWRCAETNKEE